LHSSNITLNYPARCLYHYRLELRDRLALVRTESPECDEAAHLPILLDFVDEKFHDAIKDGDNLREQGLVTYEHLWTVFRPGCRVFSTGIGRARVYKLLSYEYVCGNDPSLQLLVEFVDFDGDRFGTRTTYLQVPMFSGAVPIAGLDAFPLSFHPGADDVASLLTARGRLWEAHAGQQFREYEGVAIDPENHRYNLSGRVMIDARTFHRINAGHAFTVNAFPPSGDKRKQARESSEAELVAEEAADAFPALTDDQRLLASPMLRGFSFTEKKFLDFFVDKVAPVEWNTECFEQLVLPEDQKDLVQALVSEHTQRTAPGGNGFDDIVKGKGRGLILVLHGPPGVVSGILARPLVRFRDFCGGNLRQQLTRIAGENTHRRVRRRVLSSPSVHCFFGRSGNQQHGPRRASGPHARPGQHLEGGTAHRRGRRLPRKAVPPRHGAQRPRVHLPPHARVLQRNPLHDHQPGSDL